MIGILIAVSIASLAYIAGATIGVALGVFCYSHLYQNFKLDLDRQYAQRLNVYRNRLSNEFQKAEAAKQRLVEVYGNDLAKGHADVISEEVNRILGQGPRDGSR